MPATLEVESPHLAQGHVVVGLDEVGRGSLAGPVAVGAVALTSLEGPPEGLTDSKMLGAGRRIVIAPLVREWAASWSLGWASAREIDEWGISVALGLAAARALANLSISPDVILLDGSFDYLSALAKRPRLVVGSLPLPDAPVRTVVRGDSRCASIAGASVVAKVQRDAHMETLHEIWPAYEWNRNKGYGTRRHRDAIKEHGPTSEHRLSWSLVSG